MEQSGDQSQAAGQVLKSLEGQAPRASAEDVDRARTEQRAHVTKLMDDMEASVETQGQYFVKIGDKKPITESRERSAGFLGRKTETYDETVGYQDSRALILKAPVKNMDTGGTERTNLIVVTPDGFKIMYQYPDGSGTLKKNEFDYLLALTRGEKTPGAFSKFQGESKHTWWKIGLEFSDKENDDWPTSFRLDQAPPDVLNLFQESVQKSIAMVESPHEQNMEKAKKETQALQNADNLINSLPPRT